MLRDAVASLCQAGNLFYGAWATGVLVQTLLERNAAGDLAEAENAVGWLAGHPAAQDSALCEVTLLRLNALLAQARGDHDAFDRVRDYRAKAESFGFEHHLDWAEAM